MNAKLTLYELLGVHGNANVAELQAAYRREIGALESARANMSPQDFTDRAQLLRVALTTLTDPVSRLGYDNKLAAAAAAAQQALTGHGLALSVAAAAPAGAEVRADALSLRADALSLRADAMLTRAALDAPASRGDGLVRTVASGTLTALRRIASALGLLVLIALGAFVITRFTLGDSSTRRDAAEAKAREQTVLQEYYQTHGVRPANMAELELLEAERRRSGNQERQQDLDREKQEREARQFEEDARRRGEEVSRMLREDEERARREAAIEQDRLRYEQQRKDELERIRIEREKERWREELRR